MAKPRNKPTKTSAPKSPELSGQPEDSGSETKPSDGEERLLEGGETDQPSPAAATPPEPDRRTTPADGIAPELSPVEVEEEDDDGPRVAEVASPPPTADELFEGSPQVKDLISVGYSSKHAEQIREAFLVMVGRVREILKPELLPAEAVRIRSTAQGGHWRLKRHWAPTYELFALDDPFLSQANLSVLEDDPRIQVKFPE